MESKQDSETGSKRIWEAIWQYKWLYFWVLMACLFGVFIYFWQGASQAIDYFSGYLIELLYCDQVFFEIGISGFSQSGIQICLIIASV